MNLPNNTATHHKGPNMHCAAISHLLYSSSCISSTTSSSAIRALSPSTPSSSKSTSLESLDPSPIVGGFSAGLSGAYGVTTTGKVIVRAITAGAANKATIFPKKLLSQKWWRVGKSVCHVRYRACLTPCRFKGGVNRCEDVSVSEGTLDGYIIRSNPSTLAVGEIRGDRSCNGTPPEAASQS